MRERLPACATSSTRAARAASDARPRGARRATRRSPRAPAAARARPTNPATWHGPGADRELGAATIGLEHPARPDDGVRSRSTTTSRAGAPTSCSPTSGTRSAPVAVAAARRGVGHRPPSAPRDGPLREPRRSAIRWRSRTGGCDHRRAGHRLHEQVISRRAAPAGRGPWRAAERRADRRRRSRRATDGSVPGPLRDHLVPRLVAARRASSGRAGGARGRACAGPHAHARAARARGARPRRRDADRAGADDPRGGVRRGRTTSSSSSPAWSSTRPIAGRSRATSRRSARPARRDPRRDRGRAGGDRPSLRRSHPSPVPGRRHFARSRGGADLMAR